MQANTDGNHAADPPKVSDSGLGDSPSAFLLNSKLRNKLAKLARWRRDPSLIEFHEDTPEFRGGFATVSRAFLTLFPNDNEVGDESEHTADERPDPDAGNPSSGDLDALSQRETGEHGDNHTDKDEGTDSRLVDGDNEKTNQKGREESNDHREQGTLPQYSITTIGGESVSSEHAVDEDPGYSSNLDAQSQSGTQRPEGEQVKVEEATSHVANAKNDQTKEEEDSNRQTSQKKLIAVKKLKIEGEMDFERALGLALRELEFLVELYHPNIVRIEGFVEDVSTPKVWLVFPWEEHGNLRDFLASGEWEIPERISLIHDVTLGLDYLHDQEPPIYHGDLKSLNILVNSECYALITDFGSARRLGTDPVGRRPKEIQPERAPATHPPTGEPHITLEALFSATASTLTLTGSSYTLRWAAPELLQDDGPCLRSDIWALGWIAYEVMTNTIPFHDIKQDALIIKHVIQGRLPSVTEDARMSLIRALCSLMVQCWSINPDKRPTAEECRKSIYWMPMIVPAPTQHLDEETSQLRHAQLLSKLGQMYRRQGDYTSAISSLTAALEIYTIHKNKQGRGETLRRLADVQRFRNEYTEAVTLYSEALEIVTELGDDSERAHVIFGLAQTHFHRNDYKEAVRFYSECLQIDTQTGTKRDRATTLSGLAGVYRNQGEYNEAINLYSEARDIFTEVGDQRERAATLAGLATVHRSRHEYHEAISLYSEALQIYTEVGDHKERALTLWCLAEVHRLRGEYSEASKLYSESLQVYDDIQDRQGRGVALWGLAEMHRALNECNEAIKLCSEATQIFADIGDNYWRAQALTGLAITNQMQGHPGQAITLFTEASEVLEQMGDSDGASDALKSAAEIRKTLQEAIADFGETANVGEDPSLTSE